jgi:multidrug efflux pump subunit AcrB
VSPIQVILVLAVAAALRQSRLPPNLVLLVEFTAVAAAVAAHPSTAATQVLVLVALMVLLLLLVNNGVHSLTDMNQQEVACHKPRGAVEYKIVQKRQKGQVREV